MSKQIKGGITWGYARVSTKGQVLDRQIEALEKYGVSKSNIVTDKATGKTFEDRPNYHKLVGSADEIGILRKGDVLVIKELDRLGRNRAQVKEQLELLKEKGIRVKVLDVPTTLIDINENQEWLIEMINNILIEVLGSIAEQERIKINTRQREGINAMPLNKEGVRVSTKQGRGKYGRPKLELPKNFADVYARTRSGAITNVEAMAILGIKRATFYKYVKQLKEQGEIK